MKSMLEKFLKLLMYSVLFWPVVNEVFFLNKDSAGSVLKRPFSRVG